MINVILSGCNGKMGRVITRLVREDNDIQIVCGCDINTQSTAEYPVCDDINKFEGKADVIIDFSHPNCFDSLITYCYNTKTPILMATTGLSAEQIEKLDELSKEVAVFRSANMSIGINLLINLVKQAAVLLEDKFDIEIIEKHHNLKIDAPSGTALMIADEISSSVKNTPSYVYDRHSVRQKRTKSEIGIHAVRGGTIAGEHDVIFAGYDEILEIKHTALSREIFAKGAIKASKFMADKKSGMYDMSDVIGNI